MSLPRKHDLALAELARALPSDAVRTGVDTCTPFATDESEAEPATPEAVLHVQTTAHLAEVMRVASKHRVPIVPRGAGTGRAGGATCITPGWTVAFDGWDTIEEIDEDDTLAVVRPGVVLGALHKAAESRGLFYPPDANSWESCTLGGNIATNAGGPRAFKYGVTGHYVLGLEVVTADGTVLEVGRRTKKGVTGYDITQLLVGSEGTLALTTRATLHLISSPPAVRTLLVFLADEHDIASVIGGCLKERVVPRCVELLDAITLDILRADGVADIPYGARAMLLVELDGEEPSLEEKMENVASRLLDRGAVEVRAAADPKGRERLWTVRREMSRTLRSLSAYKLSEDVVVPRSQIGTLLQKCREISGAHHIRMPTYGHAGDGNLHVNFLWDTPDEKPRVDNAISDLLRTVIALRGTLSGEHGIGVLKAPFLPLEQSAPLIALQKKLKSTFDPQGILNPGKIFGAAGHGSC